MIEVCLLSAYTPFGPSLHLDVSVQISINRKSDRYINDIMTFGLYTLVWKRLASKILVSFYIFDCPLSDTKQITYSNWLGLNKLVAKVTSDEILTVLG